MPPPRKVDLLPVELRDWLREELVERGFGDYEALADALNNKLALSGSEMTIKKSALHAFGAEYREFVKLQEEAGDWVEGFVREIGIEGEADRHSALFQMLSSLAFKTMKSAMSEDAPDPKNLAYLSKMMKDLMSSSGLREKMKSDERARIERDAREEEQKELSGKLDEAVAAGSVDAEAAQRARVAMGFA